MSCAVMLSVAYYIHNDMDIIGYYIIYIVESDILESIWGGGALAVTLQHQSLNCKTKFDCTQAQRITYSCKNIKCNSLYIV